MMIRTLLMTAVVVNVVLTLGTSANAITGSWGFDSDPGLTKLSRDPGTLNPVTPDPNFTHTIADGILSLDMTRDGNTQRLFMDLPGGPYGQGDVLRLRTRYRTIQDASGQMVFGFYSSTEENAGTRDRAMMEWSGTKTATGKVGSDGERPTFSHAHGTWYISELNADFSTNKWTMDLFDGDTKALLVSIPGSPRNVGTFSNPTDPLDILMFGNGEDLTNNVVYSMEYDWVTFAVNEALPADVPEPATATLLGLGGLLALVLHRRRKAL